MTTVREFAERVLYGTTLADKLAPPPGSGLEDVSRGPAVATPQAPGRPDGLLLDSKGARVEFPGTAHLESDPERGRLLHFFANHELLATELMALVLLKFPDAPAEFRAGVLKTLKEEQMHTKMYLKRMQECGVEFGELPVNGFFWNLVAPMDTPLDYVTRLSLTFEQANLDYARGYAKVFKEAGDADTGGILDRIYQDEINHVHYGLGWFRMWKEQRSDWKSFCSLMHAPLSAARAKGAFEFNEEGRRQAGLDEEFIRELRVYSRSKGRTPNVHWFNPEAEDEIAGHGDDKTGEQVGRDLELLMAFVARPDDVLMMRELPPLEHRETLVDAGFEMSELCEWEQVAEVAGRKLGQARPWAATARSVETARRLGLDLKQVKSRLFSKVEHAAFLKRVLEASDWDLLEEVDAVGQAVGTIEEIDAFRQDKQVGSWLMKLPVSTAGRDRMRIPGSGEWSERDRQMLDRLFTKSSQLVMEPWCERVLDFSIQYERREGGLLRRGFVIMENSETGRFCSARATRKPFSELAGPDRRLVFPNWAMWLEETFEPLLKDWLGSYRGPLGVDAFLYRDAQGELKLKPVVEVNPRYTMGRVAVELQRFHSTGGKLVIQPAKVDSPDGATRLTPDRDGCKLVAWWCPEK